MWPSSFQYPNPLPTRDTALLCTIFSNTQNKIWLSLTHHYSHKHKHSDAEFRIYCRTSAALRQAENSSSQPDAVHTRARAHTHAHAHTRAHTRTHTHTHTHTHTQVHNMPPNTDHAHNKHMWNIIRNFNPVQAITPWWWILCVPKHLGVIFNVCLLDFYTAQILTCMTVSIECINCVLNGRFTELCIFIFSSIFLVLDLLKFLTSPALNLSYAEEN
jgi:hypothetical protein